MIVRFANGKAVEAVILTQSRDEIRAVLEGSEDTTLFVRIKDRWVSDDCEPLAIEFSWHRPQALPLPTEDECICPKALAAKLIRFLHYGEMEEDEAAAIGYEKVDGASAHHVV